MRNTSRLGALACSLVLPALLALAGCNQDPGADNGKGDHEPAPCPGCVPSQTVPYPPSSTSVTQGSVIADFSFTGFAAGNADGEAAQTISLSDFYNPHAGDPSYQPASAAEDDRLFPPKSPYGAGSPKPTALLIDIASVWCGPCNEEAKNLLNGLYARYRPCGGEFLFQLAEGAQPGTLATEALLATWVKSYKVKYPATYDPGRQLYPLYGSDSFPDSAIVDTRTMKIVDVISGLPDATFWSTYESLLDATCLAASAP